MQDLDEHNYHESCDQEYMDGQYDMRESQSCLVMAVGLVGAFLALAGIVGWLWVEGKI